MTALYCVIDTEKAPTLPADGLPGAAPPRALAIAGGLTAIVATVPDEEYAPEAVEAKLRDMDWVSRAALGHERVIEAAMQDAIAVLPMKLLTLFSGDARVMTDLARRRARLAKAAARVAHCQEYGLRITARSDEAPRASGERPSSGLAFLERKKQVRDAARERAADQVTFAREAWEALSGAARDAVQRPAAADADERPLLDAAFLVGPEDRQAFAVASERLSEAAEAAGCVMTLTGPWPPYHFVQA